MLHQLPAYPALEELMQDSLQGYNGTSGLDGTNGATGPAGERGTERCKEHTVNVADPLTGTSRHCITSDSLWYL